MNFIPVFIAFLLMSMPFGGVYAQDDASNIDERLALAKRMHEIKPTQATIESVVSNIAQQIPDGSREVFKQKLLSSIDISTIEKASIDAMVETFTAEELHAMVEYTGSEEGQSIQEKMPVYQTLIQPEISKALDAALLNVRLGDNP